MRWEYRTIKMKIAGWFGSNVDVQELADALNELGREGWELVSTLDLDTGHGHSSELVAVFKRPLP
jgi:hypothetical protein